MTTLTCGVKNREPGPWNLAFVLGGTVVVAVRWLSAISLRIGQHGFVHDNSWLFDRFKDAIVPPRLAVLELNRDWMLKRMAKSRQAVNRTTKKTTTKKTATKKRRP